MRYHKDDLPRERIEIREKDQLPYSAELIYRPLDQSAIDSDEKLKEKYELAKKICEETQILDLGLDNAKNKSKTAPKKHKKVSPKLHKAAVAKV